MNKKCDHFLLPISLVELTKICQNPKQKPYLVGTSVEMDCERGEDLLKCVT